MRHGGAKTDKFSARLSVTVSVLHASMASSSAPLGPVRGPSDWSSTTSLEVRSTRRHILCIPHLRQRKGTTMLKVPPPPIVHPD